MLTPADDSTIPSQAIPGHHFKTLSELEKGYWWYVGRLEWAERLIARHCSAKIETYADIGCGTGGFANALRHRFSIKHTVLVDAHPEALKALEKEQSGVRVLAADITKNVTLPFSPELISLMDVIEHIEDDGELLKHVHSWLLPGGRVLLSVPAHQRLYSQWDRLLGHYRRYSAGELKRKVEGSGFRVLEFHYMWSFLFPLAPWRKLRPAKQTGLEFPKVSPAQNQVLIGLSRLEWFVQRLIPAFFGTSIILIAEKRRDTNA